MARPFDPLQPDHPIVGMECHVCRRRLEAGQRPALIATVPADEEEVRKACEGRPYIAVAAPVHWACIEGTEMEDA